MKRKILVDWVKIEEIKNNKETVKKGQYIKLKSFVVLVFQKVLVLFLFYCCCSSCCCKILNRHTGCKHVNTKMWKKNTERSWMKNNSWKILNDKQILIIPSQWLFSFSIFLWCLVKDKAILNLKTISRASSAIKLTSHRVLA